MKRVVIIHSYESIKEALISKATDFAGRVNNSIPVKIATRNYKSIGSLDYSPKWVFIRKLAYKSLHIYGSGMKRIEDIIIAETEKMCSLLSKETGQPVLIHTYLGKI